MGKYSDVFVGIVPQRRSTQLPLPMPVVMGETPYLGEIDSAPATVERVIKKLTSKYEKVRMCYVMGSIGSLL